MFVTSEIRHQLDTLGYAVIPDIIPETLTDQTLCDFQAFHAQATGQQFSPEYYQRDYELKNVHGIVEFPGALSHVDFVNRVRYHPNVLRVFSEIYGTDPIQDPIQMSFDRVNYQASEEMRKITTRDRKSWWHVDQHWKKQRFECIQGYVDIVGSETDKHGGLMVLESSHLLFSTLARMHQAKEITGGWDRDWYRLDEAAYEYFISRCTPINVKCPKGGMVLWDSRTIHMSRPNRHLTDERFVIYTCGFPSSRLTPKDFTRREEAIRKRRATSHWPDARHLFPEKPRWFQKYSEEPQRIAEQWINNK
jgi:ectoine hydroxylase-related dioxygenase (phytanoyl-CoA dioxygenase family)